MPDCEGTMGIFKFILSVGITKVMPEDQKLFKDREELKDEKNIGDYGLNPGTAKPQLPATIGLVFKLVPFTFYKYK